MDIYISILNVFSFVQHVEFTVKVVGIGSYRLVVETLLKTSCSYFLCCEARLETVEMTPLFMLSKRMI